MIRDSIEGIEMRYDYKVVPAPERGEKTKGVKGPEGRFAAAIERIMNDMAERGWEYQRTDTLPSEERAGLTQTVTVWRNLLIFRRPNAADVTDLEPRMLTAPLVLDKPVVAGRMPSEVEAARTAAALSPRRPDRREDGTSISTEEIETPRPAAEVARVAHAALGLEAARSVSRPEPITAPEIAPEPVVEPDPIVAPEPAVQEEHLPQIAASDVVETQVEAEQIEAVEIAQATDNTIEFDTTDEVAADPAPVEAEQAPVVPFDPTEDIAVVAERPADESPVAVSEPQKADDAEALEDLLAEISPEAAEQSDDNGDVSDDIPKDFVLSAFDDDLDDQDVAQDDQATAEEDVHVATDQTVEAKVAALEAILAEETAETEDKVEATVDHAEGEEPLDATVQTDEQAEVSNEVVEANTAMAADPAPEPEETAKPEIVQAEAPTEPVKIDNVAKLEEISMQDVLAALDRELKSAKAEAKTARETVIEAASAEGPADVQADAPANPTEARQEPATAVPAEPVKAQPQTAAETQTPTDFIRPSRPALPQQSARRRSKSRILASKPAQQVVTVGENRIVSRRLSNGVAARDPETDNGVEDAGNLRALPGALAARAARLRSASNQG